MNTKAGLAYLIAPAKPQSPPLVVPAISKAPLCPYMRTDDHGEAYLRNLDKEGNRIRHIPIFYIQVDRNKLTAKQL